MAIDPAASRSRGRDSRRALRYPTRFSAELRIRDDRFPVVVRDISEVGAMVEGANLPGVGRHAMFAARETEAEVRIVWQRDNVAGVEFVKPVNPLAVVRHNVEALSRTRRQKS